MSVTQRLVKELKTIIITTIFFFVWFALVILLKRMLLAEYNIEVRGISLAIVGAVIVAKVVLVMERIPLSRRLEKLRPIVDLILRTLLYSVGVLAALLLEKAFEARHEYGGFFDALRHIFQHRDMPHVWVNTIVVSLALLVFNAISLLREALGEGGLARTLLAPRSARH